MIDGEKKIRIPAIVSGRLYKLHIILSEKGQKTFDSIEMEFYSGYSDDLENLMKIFPAEFIASHTLNQMGRFSVTDEPLKTKEKIPRHIHARNRR